jgi:hypothetical protein
LAITFVLLKRCRIEDADRTVVDTNGVHWIYALSRSLPIERVDVLQEHEHASVGESVPYQPRQVLRSEVRFAEEDDLYRIRHLFPYLFDLRRGVSVANSDSAQVAARQTIESADFCALSAGPEEQIAKGLPTVTPLGIVTNAMPELLITNFAALPGIEEALVAGEDHLQPEDDCSPGPGKLLHQLGCELLAAWKGVVVAHQEDVGFENGFRELGWRENV